MAKIGNVTVEIKADTRAFDRSLRRVGWQLWWFQFGPWMVVITTFLLGLVIGGVAGVVGS